MNASNEESGKNTSNTNAEGTTWESSLNSGEKEARANLVVQRVFGKERNDGCRDRVRLKG